MTRFWKQEGTRPDCLVNFFIRSRKGEGAGSGSTFQKNSNEANDFSHLQQRQLAGKRPPGEEGREER